MDWYYFDVTKSGYLKLEFDVKQTALIRDMDFFSITVFNEKVKGEFSIVSTIHPGDVPIICSFWRDVTPQRYYVNVQKKDFYTSADYAFKIHYVEEGALEKEPNNYYSEANPIAIDRVIVGEISHKEDLDWYEFELKKSGVVTLELEHDIEDPGYPRYELMLHAKGDKGLLDPLASFWGYGSKLWVTSDSLSLQAGKYSIRIRGSQADIHDTIGRYQFKVKSHGKTNGYRPMVNGIMSQLVIRWPRVGQKSLATGITLIKTRS